MDLEKLESEVLVLKHELHQLGIINHKQESRISLSQENKRLVQENQNLLNKLGKLEDKLSINSSNSGLPTSKEI